MSEKENYNVDQNASTVLGFAETSSFNLEPTILLQPTHILSHSTRKPRNL